MTLRAGTAVVDITPPVGALMAGFLRKPDHSPRRAESIRDSLRARALCLECGRETVAFVAADIAFFDRVDVQHIRQAVARSVPELGGPRLILAASHTHAGPETTYMFGNSEDDPYIREMNARIARAVVDAHTAMAPARLRAGRGRCELAHNRRVRKPDGSWTMVFEYDPDATTGARDDEISVLAFDREDGVPVAVLYNYAAHALTLGPLNMAFSADFPGVASGAIESRYPGCTALFLNGGAGDQHPRKSMQSDYAVTEEIGNSLAQRAGEVLEAAEANPGEPGLGFLTHVASFPNRVHPEVTVDVEMSCIRIGPAVICVLPGEPFVEFQLAAKRAVAPAVCLFVGYANGWCGYIPTRVAYEEGGYGVELYRDDPPGRERTALPAGAGETLLERLLGMVDDV